MIDHAMISDLRSVEILQELLNAGHVILMSRDEDGLYTGSAGRKCAAAESLESFFEELTVNPRRKVCLRKDCASSGAPLPLSRFGPDPDTVDGKTSVCKACESKRVLAIKQKKKLEALPANHSDKSVQA